MHHIGMNLTQRDGTHLVRPDGMEEVPAVVKHTLARIPVRETEIQDAFAICRELAVASRACAESVDEPIERRECGSFEDLQAARAPQLPFGGCCGCTLSLAAECRVSLLSTSRHSGYDDIPSGWIRREILRPIKCVVLRMTILVGSSGIIARRIRAGNSACSKEEK